MSIADSLFGRPLATSEERAEHIGVAAGIPIFGLDGLTSAAYGPEAAMTLLIPLGVEGGEFGWCDGADLGCAEPATPYVVDMSGDSCASGNREFAGRKGHGDGVYFADV